ncbi:hypothetical protein DERF_000811 [Dermatophagoides farinae]|uniref:Uncharacterized protein n=1 Tax=Dermatophagoides farinae TaxID=6954 RepID=A0A922L8Q6_DERFA|nr:hypothetical protein DERF_000811 [Dermatophagoides farinae]
MTMSWLRINTIFVFCPGVKQVKQRTVTTVAETIINRVIFAGQSQVTIMEKNQQAGIEHMKKNPKGLWIGGE